MNKWERNADRWRLQLPVPRYLRRSPMQAMRERLYFVSRIQPKIDVTVNLANNVRIQSLAAVPSTVFRHLWQVQRAEVPAVTRAGALAAMPRLGLSLKSISPLAKPRKELRQEPIVGAVVKQAAVGRDAIEGSTPVVPALIPKLAVRARRIEDLTPFPAARVVKRGSAAAASEAISSSRETPGWSEPRRGFPGIEPGSFPLQAPVQPPSVNVEQLTDQVLRQLDRRLIASRERLGRI